MEEERSSGQVPLSPSLSSIGKVTRANICNIIFWGQRVGSLSLTSKKSIFRVVRLLLQLLLVVVLVLLYFHQEEALGEVKAVHARLFPPSLPPAPTWKATKAALANLPLMPTTATTESGSASICHLPVLDPWHPSILPYVSDKPSLVR